MPSFIVETKQLTKRYGQKFALKNIQLKIKRGEIYGLVGLNGAGKTTLMRLLLGMIRPTKGSIIVDEKCVTRRSYDVWQRVGYLIEDASFYPNLTVEQNLSLTCRLRSCSFSNVEQLLNECQLTLYRNKKVKQLSLGNKKRLALAKALIHEPNLLLLDEPANGLDPDGIDKLRTLLRYLANEKRVTIIFSSHLLGEVSRLAHRIGFMHNGEVIAEKTTAEIEDELSHSVIIETNETKVAKQHLYDIGISANSLDEQTIEIKDPAIVKQRERILSYLVKKQIPIRQFTVKRESLERYFLRMVRERK